MNFDQVRSAIAGGNFRNMRSAITALSILVLPFLLNAQRVLHFTKTSGFDHATRDASLAMFSSIGTELGIQVDHDNDGSTFDLLSDLIEYDVIVFSNTSGNAILDQQQRTNFEAWVAQGGNVMGIHAATDTYRHSTADGGGTGVWDFYAELIGGSVQADPPHVAGTPLYAMSHIEPHPSTANIPDPWEKEEEYYYWQNGYLHPMNIPVLEVEQTVGPNGQINSYDVHRPMSWYRVTAEGRVFYTALGHAITNYTDDLLFRTHVKDALIWLLGGSASVSDDPVDQWTLLHDRALQMLQVEIGSRSIGERLLIHDALGKCVIEKRIGDRTLRIATEGHTGPHFISIGDQKPARKILILPADR